MDSVEESLACKLLFSRLIVPVLVIDARSVEAKESGCGAYRNRPLPFFPGSAGSTLRKALE